jgi:hypothetical protein
MKRQRPRLGAYTSRGGKHTRLSVIAFIDCLGFKQQIRRADESGDIDALLSRAWTFLSQWRRADHTDGTGSGLVNE